MEQNTFEKKMEMYARAALTIFKAGGLWMIVYFVLQNLDPRFGLWALEEKYPKVIGLMDGLLYCNLIITGLYTILALFLVLVYFSLVMLSYSKIARKIYEVFRERQKKFLTHE